MNLWSNDSSNLKSCRCSNPCIHNNQQIILVSLSQSRRWCLDLRLLLHSPSCSPRSRSPESENTGNIQHWRFIPAGQKQNFPQLGRKDGSSQLWLCRLLPLSRGAALSLNCLLTDSYWFTFTPSGIRRHRLTHRRAAHAHKPQTKFYHKDHVIPKVECNTQPGCLELNIGWRGRGSTSSKFNVSEAF